MIEREILFYLKDIGKEVSYEEMTHDLKINNMLVFFHLRDLVNRGNVKKIQRGEKFYYCLS